jgi:hypothetical protein
MVYDSERPIQDPLLGHFQGVLDRNGLIYVYVHRRFGGPPVRVL